MPRNDKNVRFKNEQSQGSKARIGAVRGSLRRPEGRRGVYQARESARHWKPPHARRQKQLYFPVFHALRMRLRTSECPAEAICRRPAGAGPEKLGGDGHILGALAERPSQTCCQCGPPICNPCFRTSRLNRGRGDRASQRARRAPSHAGCAAPAEERRRCDGQMCNMSRLVTGWESPSELKIRKGEMKRAGLNCGQESLQRDHPVP
jgi:hypothetical protein